MFKHNLIHLQCFPTLPLKKSRLTEWQQQQQSEQIKWSLQRCRNHFPSVFDHVEATCVRWIAKEALWGLPVCRCLMKRSCWTLWPPPGANTGAKWPSSGLEISATCTINVPVFSAVKGISFLIKSCSLSCTMGALEPTYKLYYYRLSLM